MGYQYRGTIHDLDEPVQSRRPPSDVFDPSRCGTYAGYKQHQNRGIPACQACKDAQAAYSRDYHQRRKTQPSRTKGFDPSACGTYAGYARHGRSNVHACDACLAAYAEYMSGYRAKQALGRRHSGAHPNYQA